MTLPDRFADLRLFGGDTPIPFVQAMNGDTPDFRKLDPDKQAEAVRKHLCHVCGRPLDYWLTFIGGPGSVERRLFRDGPMHDDCARWSIRNCPYLDHNDPGAVNPAPDRIALYVCRSFEYLSGMFVPAKAKRLEWRSVEVVKSGH